MGIGTVGTASPRLQAICDDYVFWGTLVAEVEPSLVASVEEMCDIARAETVLLSAMELSGHQPVAGAWLKSKMRELDPLFDERNFDCDGFKEFLLRFPHAVTVILNDGGDMRVRLASEANVDLPLAEAESSCN